MNITIQDRCSNDFSDHLSIVSNPNVAHFVFEGARPVVRLRHCGAHRSTRCSASCPVSDPARYQRTAAQLIEGAGTAPAPRAYRWRVSSSPQRRWAYGYFLVMLALALGISGVALAAVSAVPRAVAPEPVDDHRRIRGLCDRRPGLGADRRTHLGRSRP